MIRTVVCQKEGCSGNRFYVESVDNKLKATCMECGNKYLFDISHFDFTLTSSCMSCKNDTFKIFRDIDTENIYLKCSECGSPPEKLYIDADGIQVSYGDKLLQEIKDLMYKVDQRVCNLEIKMEGTEHGQRMIEEALAYINKYIVEDR